MQVARLEPRGFRNLVDRPLELPAGVALLHGPNGAGKTNVLEALYFGLTGRSCRTSRAREVIRFGESLARSEVEVGGGGDAASFLGSISTEEGRRHLLDGRQVEPADARRRPAIAVFMPDRLALVKGPPGGRRSHLDRLAAALWPGHAGVRRRYHRGLAQRNALLTRVRSGAAPPDSLDAWDRELAASAVELSARRASAIGLLGERFATLAGELGLGEGAAIRYRPRSGGAGAAELERELRSRRPADLARGHTGYGPHLDEVALEHRGRSLRRYGSQGQQRIALLALLFAEREALLAERHAAPLMLLDDLMSELDSERRELLVERLLVGGGQALVTATDAVQVPRRSECVEMRVEAGRVESEAQVL